MKADRFKDYMEACECVPTVVCTTANQREMFTNSYFAACELIGGLENTMWDYEEDSDEHKNAKKTLEDRQYLIDEIYSMALHHIYEPGCSWYSEAAERMAKANRFAGKEWSLEAIAEIVRSFGH